MSDSTSVILVILTQKAIYEFESREYIRLTKICKPNTIIKTKKFRVEWMNTKRFSPLFGKFVSARDLQNIDKWCVLTIEEFRMFDHDQVGFTGILPLVYNMDWYQDLTRASFDYESIIRQDNNGLLC